MKEIIQLWLPEQIKSHQITIIYIARQSLKINKEIKKVLVCMINTTISWHCGLRRIHVYIIRITKKPEMNNVRQWFIGLSGVGSSSNVGYDRRKLEAACCMRLKLDHR